MESEIPVGVLFENSIVCHVFYAIVGWLALVFWGWLFLFCFGLPALVFLVGSGVGWAWSGFLDFFDAFCGWSWLVGWGWFMVCVFCLESLILAQDERWRRA